MPRAAEAALIWVTTSLAMATIVITAVIFLAQRKSPHIEKSAMAVQALATTFALMIAGYWYVYERKGQPHADVALTVAGVKVADDRIALQTGLAVRNLGATLLDVGEADVRLQSMRGDDLPLDAILALDWDQWPAKIGPDTVYVNGVLQWPTRRWFKGGGEMHIEPGERDSRTVDFLVTCRDRALRVVSALRDPGGPDLWWRGRTFVSLNKLCGEPVGSKEIWDDEKG